ncbi:hypothetical protein NEOLEDRAFT_1069004 [Neolentinus lepideus HHB14362 ss-1]|uniref:Large ribosomal subunit protein mL59 domain-containing protein n=1 Tax=Neolentinus lepideus HHB14362 ss-1 TaxID=1314782 RepID=A0A165RE89_9AGAM|nr:hypothetical protein NEOLEDRAFT_1069004 [Neolentinus lepideus HHB14362 ss-1]
MAVSVAAATKALKKFRIDNLPGRQLRAAAVTTQKSVKQPIVEARNPFLPVQNPYSGKWAKPRYSLRMQKELVKKAKACGMVGLLPPGPKLSLEEIEAAKRSETVAPRPDKKQDWWLRPVEWSTEPLVDKAKKAGLVTMYVGRKRMFKGHKWERVRSERLRRHRIAMKGMAKQVKSYKSFYHRRRPSPLATPRANSQKLPF